MASKKKVIETVVKKETKDYGYVSEFFKTLNAKIKEVSEEQQEAQNSADSYDNVLETLRGIRSDMADLFEEQGCENAYELAGLDDYRNNW